MMTGSRQAVHLPAEFRFEGSGVFIRRDPLTGDVSSPASTGWTSWDEFLAQRDLTAVPADFLADHQQPLQQIRDWPLSQDDTAQS